MIFRFFPCLHAIFASRPNVTPICVTTPLGPHGRSTVWYQPPNHDIDPQLLSPAPVPSDILANSQNAPTATPSRAFGSDVTSTINEAEPPIQPPLTPTPGIENTPTQNRLPKSSVFSKDILEKARASIQAVSKKRTLGETLMDIQRLHDFILLHHLLT
jgi:hypothetical protein